MSSIAAQNVPSNRTAVAAMKAKCTTDAVLDYYYVYCVLQIGADCLAGFAGMRDEYWSSECTASSSCFGFRVSSRVSR